MVNKDYWKMEEGYYSPKVEDFHVGFIYEVASTMPLSLVWDSVVWGEDPNAEFEFVRGDIKQGTIRVKYLDKEDIEDCGWEFRNSTIKNSKHQYFNKGEKSLSYTESTKEVTIHMVAYDWDSCCFDGTVNNKSELKKILQMLSIK